MRQVTSGLAGAMMLPMPKHIGAQPYGMNQTNVPLTRLPHCGATNPGDLALSLEAAEAWEKQYGEQVCGECRREAVRISTPG